MSTSPQPSEDAIRPEPSIEKTTFSKLGVSGPRILAPWGGRVWLYPGLVTKVDGPKSWIEFDDGSHGWVDTADVRPFDLRVGSWVYCRFQDAADYHFASIAQMDGTLILINYGGGRREWTTLSRVRVVKASQARQKLVYSLVIFLGVIYGGGFCL